MLCHGVGMMTRLALHCGIEAILWQVHIELVNGMLRHWMLLRQRGALLRLLRWRMRTLGVGRQRTSGEKRLVVCHWAAAIRIHLILPHTANRFVP